MSYFEIIITGSPVKLIPLGDCACGCGGKTLISKHTHKKRGWIKGQPRKFAIGHRAKCRGWWKAGNNPRWNGNRSSITGYPTVYMPGHPRSNKITGFVIEHILIAEKALGKLLPENAVIHHANGSRNGGTIVICQDRPYHNFLHQRMRALKACGHASWRKCNYCKKYSPHSEMKLHDCNSYIHIDCRKTKNRGRR